MVTADQTYTLGDNVTLECASMGGPDNTFQWLLNEAERASESSLILQSVRAVDGGVYTCVVSNAAGTSNATTSIFISPYFTSQPQAMGGANDTVVTLTCEAEAFPAPTYQWSQADGGMIRTGVMGQTTALLMFDPLLFRDEGDYVCNATSMGVTIQSQPATLSGKNPIATSVQVKCVFVYIQLLPWPWFLMTRHTTRGMMLLWSAMQQWEAQETPSNG